MLTGCHHVARAPPRVQLGRCVDAGQIEVDDDDSVDTAARQCPSNARSYDAPAEDEDIGPVRHGESVAQPGLALANCS